MALTSRQRLRVDGRFLSSAGQRQFLRCVTLGPFPPGQSLEAELPDIRAAGFHAVRLYTAPTLAFLEAASAEGLWVFASIPWGWGGDFLDDRREWKKARASTTAFLKEYGDHPALAGLYVANEIPASLLRWSGPQRVQEALEAMIDEFRAVRPELLYAYANFPTTEYLELRNADFTAFNLYLEEEESLQSYLRHLQVVAGHRPLLISEFGVDRGSHSPQRLAQLHAAAWHFSEGEGCAGLTLFSWSDHWWNRGQSVEGWFFGLKTKAGELTAPALEVAKRRDFARVPELFSLIVCSYGGEQRIGPCLEALLSLRDECFEVIVVDDGSLDGTYQKALTYREAFDQKGISYQVLTGHNEGLSAARNRGAQAARGLFLAYTDDDARPDIDWVFWLRRSFAPSPQIGMVGGYGLCPAVGGSFSGTPYPGQAAPVLLSDDRAEHLPGCNLAVRKDVWEAVEGFRPVYRTAGDDVDFCWRVLEAGYDLRFQAAAYVWHEPRHTLRGYIQQQWGYGQAEAQLSRDHPARFTHSGVRWKGVTYLGEPLTWGRGSVVYEGWAGTAPFQPIVQFPSQGATRGASSLTRIKGRLMEWGQPLVRAIGRWSAGFPFESSQLLPLLQTMIGRSAQGAIPKRGKKKAQSAVQVFWREHLGSRQELLEQLVQEGWQQCFSPHWDLQNGSALLQILLEEPTLTGQRLKIRGNELAAVASVLEKAGWRAVSIKP